MMNTTNVQIFIQTTLYHRLQKIIKYVNFVIFVYPRIKGTPSVLKYKMF
jgi:hypothetical protein